MLLADKVAVVIPCLNEGATIARLVLEIRKFLPKVIVVDDGSADSTGTLAASSGAEVLRHDQPCGKGTALNLGLKRASEQGFPWALVMDGDGQHAPSDIPLFLEAITNAPLVLGNRMTNPGAMPWLRKTVNRWMSQRLSNLANQILADTQCGFRLIELECWRQLNLQTAHFEIESEILLAFIAAGHAVTFVPIQVIYKNERSKIQPVRDTLRWFRWLVKARRQFQISRRRSEASVLKSSLLPASPALQSKTRLSPP